MALRLSTSDPAGLLAAIKRAIDSGAVETWAYDNDGDFTHTPPQWKRKAWLRPSIGTGELVLSTINPVGQSITWEVYAVYMGRFAEMATAHFHGSFTKAVQSAAPSSTDKVG